MPKPPDCECPQESGRCSGTAISTNGLCNSVELRNNKIKTLKSCKYPEKYWIPGMKWGK